MIPNYQNQYMNNPYYQNYYTNNVQQYPGGQTNGYGNIQTGISGKFIESFDNIAVNDIPMDGKPATFIKNDLSEIQLRSWTPNGQIQNVVFKPIENDKPNNSTPSAEKSVLALSDEVTDLFNGLNLRLDKIEKALAPKTTRKKVENDE